MFDANFVVLIAFIIFMFMALRYGYKRSLTLVDDQIGDIKKVLDQAENAFLLAEEKNTQAKKVQIQLSEDIVQLMEKTDEQIHGVKQQSVRDLNHLMESKQIILDSMIDQLRFKTVEELKQTVSQGAHRVLSEIMSHHLDKKMHKTLNDDAIERLEKALQNSNNRNESMETVQREKKISR